MTLQPLRRYTTPCYPTRQALEADPEALRTMPRRWQMNAAVMAVLMGAGLLAISHTAFSADAPQAGTVTTPAPIVARVAPLFTIAKAPELVGLAGGHRAPHLLTEEEARQIIVEEAQQAGIHFDADVLALKDMRMPTTLTGPDGKQTLGMVPVTQTLDGTDSKRHISYEYISTADVQGWQQAGVTVPAGATPAQMFHDRLTQGVPAGTVAVFYDPDSNPVNGEDLRQQVRDFVAWLKAMGVI